MHATAANFYISKFFHLAQRNGLDTAALLAQADIPADIIDSPDTRVEVEKLATFIISISDQLQDESMSLSASPVPRGSFYMMGKLTVHEPTLRQALLQMQRFFAMVTRAFTLRLDTFADTARLSFAVLNPELDTDHLFAELNLLMLHRYSSWLIAENIPLITIEFSYAPPEQVKEYAFLFPGKHRFNADTTGFTFSRQYLERRTAQNSGTVKSFMQRCPMELFRHPKSDFSLSSEVYALLRKQRSIDLPLLDTVAEALLLTKRTLIRRLKEEGASFQQIKDQVRRDLAIYYLASKQTPISEIAAKAGFSDPSVFTRAFKSWTGVSPREYRASVRNK